MSEIAEQTRKANPSWANVIPHKFKPGNPGGPGRPKGRRSFPAIVREAISDEEAVALVRLAYEKAMAGSREWWESLAKTELADRAFQTEGTTVNLALILPQLRELPTETIRMLVEAGEPTGDVTNP